MDTNTAHRGSKWLRKTSIWLAFAYISIQNAYVANNLDQAVKNRTDIAEIQRRYKTGEITREQAKELAKPVIERINQQTIIKTKELNKKYGMNRKPALVDFINLMRNTY